MADAVDRIAGSREKTEDERAAAVALVKGEAGRDRIGRASRNAQVGCSEFGENDRGERKPSSALLVKMRAVR
jgi:hypothetical protein